jgi:hypothetical protein
MRGVRLDMEGRISLRMSSSTEMASSTVTLKPSSALFLWVESYYIRVNVCTANRGQTRTWEGPL